MGSLLDEDGVTVQASVCLSDSPESSKKEKIRIRIRLVDQPAPSEKRLHILLTKDDDAAFYYFLDISETDFRTFRQRQGLLVDITAFPAMLEGLLNSCRVEESSLSPKFLPILVKNSSPSLDSANFEITETNLYRRLIHLSLEMRRGTDAKIREHLAERLARIQTDFNCLSDKFRHTEAEIANFRNESCVLKEEVDRLRREKTVQESDFLGRLSKELAEERKRLQIEIASVKSNYENERRQIIEEHSRSIRQLQNQTASLEYENKDLSEKKHRYEAIIQTMSEEKKSMSEELTRLRKDLEIHREKTNFLGAGNHELDRNLNRLEAKVTLLEQEKARLIDDLNRQNESIKDFIGQKKSVEAELTEKKNLVTKREEAVKNVSRELLKANDVIKKLQEQNRKLNNKVKLGYEVLKEQERILTTKDSELDGVRQELKKQDEKVSELQLDVRKLEHTAEDYERKVEDLNKKIKTDETVIQWLNKQLTFAQSRDPGLRLGPPPEFLATSTPLPAGSQFLRDSGMVTPKNLTGRPSDKENERQGLDPKYLRPSISASAIERPKSGMSRTAGNRKDGSAVPSPTSAGLLRSTVPVTAATNGPLKSKNQQSVYFAKT